MSEDTYYTVLGIPETATQEEVKRAYRELIRQVHPDSVPNASAYWKRASEEKSKELNEAYRVLFNPSHRAAYDKQLASFRRNEPLIRSPWAPDEVVRAGPDLDAPPPRVQPSGKTGFDLPPFLRWAGRYPVTASFLVVILFLPVVRFFSGPKRGKAAMAAESAVPDGFYTAFPCLDARDAVSPIDGKPCWREQSTTALPAATETKPSTRPTAPRWFYVTPNGIHALGGEPNDDSCGRIDAKDAAACVASLRFCPQGVWSRNCVSYSKWRMSNLDPPRVEKPLPVWR